MEFDGMESEVSYENTPGVNPHGTGFGGGFRSGVGDQTNTYMSGMSSSERADMVDAARTLTHMQEIDDIFGDAYKGAPHKDEVFHITQQPMHYGPDVITNTDVNTVHETKTFKKPEISTSTGGYLSGVLEEKEVEPMENPFQNLVIRSEKLTPYKKSRILTDEQVENFYDPNYFANFEGKLAEFKPDKSKGSRMSLSFKQKLENRKKLHKETEIQKIEILEKMEKRKKLYEENKRAEKHGRALNRLYSIPKTPMKTDETPKTGGEKFSTDQTSKLFDVGKAEKVPPKTKKAIDDSHNDMSIVEMAQKTKKTKKDLKSMQNAVENQSNRLEFLLKAATSTADEPSEESIEMEEAPAQTLTREHSKLLKKKEEKYLDILKRIQVATVQNEDIKDKWKQKEVKAYNELKDAYVEYLYGNKVDDEVLKSIRMKLENLAKIAYVDNLYNDKISEDAERVLRMKFPKST
jgi:hypothetical protein